MPLAFGAVVRTYRLRASYWSAVLSYQLRACHWPAVFVIPGNYSVPLACGGLATTGNSSRPEGCGVGHNTQLEQATDKCSNALGLSRRWRRGPVVSIGISLWSQCGCATVDCVASQKEEQQKACAMLTKTLIIARHVPLFWRRTSALGCARQSVCRNPSTFPDRARRYIHDFAGSRTSRIGLWRRK